jgi:hypothetical protein
VLDTYALKARVAPAVIAGAPALLLTGASVFDLSTTGTLFGLVVGAGGILVCGLVRGKGLRIQPRLWSGWGGPPATQRMRWSQNDPEVVARRHGQVEAATGEILPSEIEEKQDPRKADRRYSDAVEILREKTRTSDFAPLASENAEYGFRRNCLGIRPIAIAVAVAVGTASVALILIDGSARFWVDGGVAIAAALGWWKLVAPEWVRSAAELYADRLMEAAAGLAAE